jgi:hypothetical protein
MITKSKVWEKIKKELKEVERSKRLTAEIMNRIKDTPQDENNQK